MHISDNTIGRNVKVDKRSPDSLNVHVDGNEWKKLRCRNTHRHLESAAFYQFEYFLGSLPGAVEAGSILRSYPADERKKKRKNPILLSYVKIMCKTNAFSTRNELLHSILSFYVNVDFYASYVNTNYIYLFRDVKSFDQYFFSTINFNNRFNFFGKIVYT